MNQETEKVECLIIGSGPAGFTAAIYAARADMKPVMYEGLQPGGQLTITTDVENYPGYPDGIEGPMMMDHFKKQAVRLGADIRFGIVTSVDFSQRPFTCIVDEKKTIVAESIIIATGASAKWLGIPSEQKLNGSGVSACAVCDGFFFRGQTVAIVGAGDTAAEEATYLAKLCQKVYMIVRRDEMRASKAMQQASLMAILGFPLIIPQLLVLMKIANIAFSDIVQNGLPQLVGLLVGFDVMIIALAYILFPLLWKD